MPREYKNVKILIVPSELEEDYFEGCLSYSDAYAVAYERKIGETYEFDTKDELEAFIKGYNAGLGNNGNGLFFVKYE